MNINYSILIDSLDDKLDNLMLFNIYYYYWNKGYRNIIISEILNILVLTISVFMILFLFLVVNFKKLLAYDNDKHIDHISNYLDWSSFKHPSAFMIITLLFFGIYLVIRIINLIAMNKNFKKVRKLYRDMMISDASLNTISWNDVLTKVIRHYQDPFIDHYNMTCKIMNKDNIMIFLYQNKSDIFDKHIGGRFYEWNFIFCLLNPLFDKNHKIKREMILNPDTYFKNVQERITRVMFLNIIFMPAILIFMTFYFFLQYGEQFYNNPEMIISRQWNIKAKWTFRSYNEISHLYYQRLEKGSKAIDEYSKQFASKGTEIFARFVVYVLGSFLLFLVIMAFLNERLLMYMDITTGKPFIWYIGIFTPIILLAKKFTTVSYVLTPKEKYKEIINEIDFPSDWEHKSESRHIKDQVLKYYPLRINLLLTEFISIIMSPYYLWKMKKDVNDLCKLIIDNLEEDNHMGYVIKDSLFKNVVHLETNNKIKRSFYRFRYNHPDWIVNEFLNIEESYQGNIPDRIENNNFNDYQPNINQELSYPDNYDPFEEDD
jgi:autophagy-related protein 9